MSVMLRPTWRSSEFSSVRAKSNGYTHSGPTCFFPIIPEKDHYNIKYAPKATVTSFMYCGSTCPNVVVFENQWEAFDCVERVVVLDVLVQAVHAILVIRQTCQNG